MRIFLPWGAAVTVSTTPSPSRSRRSVGEAGRVCRKTERSNGVIMERRSTLFLDCRFRRLKTDLAVSSVAERLHNRASAAAERSRAALLDRALVALRVDDFCRPGPAVKGHWEARES